MMATDGNRKEFHNRSSVSHEELIIGYNRKKDVLLKTIYLMQILHYTSYIQCCVCFLSCLYSILRLLDQTKHAKLLSECVNVLFLYY